MKKISKKRAVFKLPLWQMLLGLVALTPFFIVLYFHYHDAPQAAKVGLAQESWKITKFKNNAIEGYASAESVLPGGNIGLHISCNAKTFNIDLYRMGYYDGVGAKKVASFYNKACHEYSVPTPDPQTGLVNAEWPGAVNVKISQQWAPGIYLAKLTSSNGYQAYIPFTVDSPVAKNRFLFIHAVNTDEAYNDWGGNSLYNGYTKNLKITRAVKVSFNRPFAEFAGPQNGSGNFLLWEYPMINFLEKYGYKVDYATDVDINNNPGLLLKYKDIIIAGHDEYWSRQMLEGYQTALNRGVNLSVFGANTAFRPIRYESDPKTGAANRIIVDYKSLKLDPYYKLGRISESTPVSWRDLNQPESLIMGLSYGSETSKKGTVSANLTVSDDSSWVFANTGLKNGDEIKGIVGYEFDEVRKTEPSPPNLKVVFSSPLINVYGKEDRVDSAYYTSSGGGQVFDAGTIRWSWGLDQSRVAYSPKLVQITKNILNRFGGVSR